MNFLADECCDALVVAGLRSDGHDVLYIQELAPGSDDTVVLQMAEVSRQAGYFVRRFHVDGGDARSRHQ